MNKEIEKIAPTSNPRLVARNHQEMLVANESIKEWMEGKIASLEIEASELQENLQAAKRNKWRHSGFQLALNRLNRSIIFYKKIAEAVQAGYTIIPDFPIDVFAIRTVREAPLPQDYSTTGWGEGAPPEHPPQELPPSSGKYVSPFPSRFTRKEISKDEQGKKITTRHYWNEDFKDVEFPVTAVRPEVMDATQQAMTMRIFDQIGICPASRRRDPMIIGRIIQKRGWTTKSCSFLIAWFLDVRTL